MALIEIKWNPSEREARQFAVYWLPAFFVTAGVLSWYQQVWNVAYAFWGMAILVSLAGLFIPAARRYIFVGWMCAAYPIGWAMSHILMAIIFFLVITPIGCLLRLCGHDPLHRKFDRAATTYWVPHPASNDKARYFRQF